MKKKNEAYEQSLIQTPLLTFLEVYNLGIPKGFPCATTAMLAKFQSLYPTLFKHGNTWSVAQHRKRLIDWLSANKTTNV